MGNLPSLPELLRNQDWARAERLLRKSAGAKDAPAEVYYNLAKVLEAAGKPAQRITWLKRAVARRPDYAIAWFELGRAFLDRADLSSAAQAFDRAVALDPTDGDARRLSARVALRQGLWDKASTGFAGAQDTEARCARYRIAAETGQDTRDLRMALLGQEDRAETLRVLTRVSKGAIPLKLPQSDRT